MDHSPNGQAREMRLMKLGAAAVIGTVGLGMTLALFLVSRAIDASALRDEQALVERRVQRSLASLTDDITSASIWNDAVAAIDRRDLEWMQINFGDYYADYMDHAVTLVFDGDGALMQASRDSEPVGAASEAPLIAATQGLLAQVRQDSTNAKRRAAIGFDAVATRSGVVRAGGALYLVAAATIVPEEEEPIARPAHDAVVVSAKPIAALIGSMSADLGLQNPRLTPADADHLALLRSQDDAPLVGLTWTPERPGRQVLMTLVPVFAALFIAFLIAAALMWRRIAANVRRLSESETALSQALAAADSANVAKTRFLANMSHELRTPLNGVLGMSEIVLMSGLTGPQRAQVSVIKQSGEHLLSMIERILEMAHIDSDLSPPEAQPFDPATVAAQVVAGLRDKAIAKRLALTEALPPAGLRLGDAGRVAKVLHAVVDNAIQFTPQGSVRVAMTSAPDQIVLTVTDTGVGMSADTQSRLFMPFSQGDDSATRTVDGAGLGLALAKRLVVSMGGSIDFDTRVGSGSTFRITLPAPIAAPALAPSLAA
jgi:signal transduction histidine kinase